MKTLQNCKFGISINPVSINAATATKVAFDLQSGGPYLELAVVVQNGAVGADMTSLKVIESTASDLSGATDVTNATFTNPTTAGVGPNTVRVAFVPMGGPRKRYIGVTATAGAGATLISALYIGVPGQMPNNATEVGVTEALYAS